MIELSFRPETTELHEGLFKRIMIDIDEFHSIIKT
jgi:hypothetical protein